MAISINLVRDWEDIQIGDFQRFISSWGFESQALNRYIQSSPQTEDWNKTRDDVLMTWFNFQHRLIPIRPRKLVPNPSLVCPPEVAQGWAMLQNEVTSGKDLTPRLSRKIVDADYNDGMLNDWGLYHFHLGTTRDPKHSPLMQGTAIVLLAIVETSEFCPVDFVRHAQWGDKNILAKAISVFPERFEKFCLKGVTEIATPCLDDNIVEIRKIGMNCIVQIGNKFYLPPGMGVTTAGTSIAATMKLDKYRRQFQRLEQELRVKLDAQHYSGEVRLIRLPSDKNSFQLEYIPPVK